MNKHPLSCQCGQLCGEVEVRPTHGHVICYCADCQAFARFLENDSVLDKKGGTQIVQLSPSQLKFTQGAEHLAAIRLTEKGMYRWYAKCCNTPIGNTLTNAKMPFVGLIHNCLTKQPLSTSFGNIKALFNTKYARSPQPIKDKGVFSAVLTIISLLVKGRFSGDYRKTPFFKDDGNPVTEPFILSAEELGKVKDVNP